MMRVRTGIIVRMRTAVLAIACALAACHPRAPVPSTAAPRDALPFIDDDYARALAEARARHVPLFVESWAPW
jgi:hypothetical protein